jgi:alpha-tubulin suppressor-like RCC1 family protein
VSSASTLKDVVAICAASFHLAALTSDGNVVCCGEGVPAPVDLGPAVAVSCGAKHNAALLADGKVVCWGDNEFGQCIVPESLVAVVCGHVLL